MREHYLRGQNVVPRHPKRQLRAFLALAVPSALLLGSFALGTRFPARPAPSWPPAKVRLVPPIPEPQTPIQAYVSTDQHWLIQVTWEPVRGPKEPARFLGVEPAGIVDPGVCRIHVAAEVGPVEQLMFVEAGVRYCYEGSFIREPAAD